MSTEIDVPRLRQLALIVRHRSFSKAAESVGISQPALSKNIRSLERTLGEVKKLVRELSSLRESSASEQRKLEDIDARVGVGKDELAIIWSALDRVSDEMCLAAPGRGDQVRPPSAGERRRVGHG